MSNLLRKRGTRGTGSTAVCWGPTGAVLTIVGLGIAVQGCAPKVRRDEFEQTIAELQGDIDGLDTRVGDNTTRIGQHEEVIAQLRAELSDLAADFGEMQSAIVEIEDGLRFVTPVHFDFDRDDIRPEDEPLLDRFARVAERYYPAAIVTVEGFADPAGSAAYNRDLSERRARNVADYLTAQGGLPADGIRTAAYGEDRLVIPGAQGPGRAGLENRRVTFVIELGDRSVETVTSRERGGSIGSRVEGDARSGGGGAR